MDSAEDYLAISGIQHFCFCRRQWALIHLEQQWAENRRTAYGKEEFDDSLKNLVKEMERNGLLGECGV